MQLAHRVVWALAHGLDLNDVPIIIDHRDLDGTNNRLSNLRAADYAKNGHNRGLNSNNSSGTKGVHFNRAVGKWAARIGVSGSRIELGYFDTCEAAAEARLAAQHLHGEFARMTANDNLQQREAA